MTTADNQETGTGGPSAGNQEHFIPKSRFDEVTARLREVQEEARIKDQIINQSLAVRNQPAPQGEPVFNAEELGVDPQVAQAAAKIAKQMVSHELGIAKQQISGLIGQMGQELDTTKFLMNHGKDKSSYLPQIEDYRQRHLRATGQWMDAEVAFKLIRFDEMERAASRKAQQDPPAPAAAAAQPAQAASPSQAGSAGPSAANTRVVPGAPANAGGAKAFNELSPEEMEARLDEAFSEGHTI